jgi:hypothetical protein
MLSEEATNTKSDSFDPTVYQGEDHMLDLSLTDQDCQDSVVVNKLASSGRVWV